MLFATILFAFLRILFNIHNNIVPIYSMVIKSMSVNDLLDMHYFLTEDDDDDDFAEEGFYIF